MEAGKNGTEERIIPSLALSCTKDPAWIGGLTAIYSLILHESFDMAFSHNPDTRAKL